MLLRILLALALVLAPCSFLSAAVSRDFVVDLAATVSDNAPHITLTWTQRVQSNITAQKIHRRLKGAATWAKLADLSTTQTSFTDATAVPGVEYEYWMERNLTGLTPNVAMGYISAGVKVPEVHSRGVLLLVVDDTMAVPLAPEIAQLKTDLAADGWTLQQINAPRNGTAASTKALIKAAYDADPANVKMVYLLGHVPVPYSGNQAPDGHGDHVGAWPADGYYGDMDGIWTDSTVNNTSASRAQNDNIPGDGKFDQVNFPSLVELQVGRVDLHTLNRVPSSSVTETARLRRYLRKAHEYRHKLGAYAAIPRRTLIRDGFGHAFSSEPFAIAAWMGAFANLGQGAEAPIDEAPSGNWFSSTYAGGKDYLWGHGCGGGSHESASSLGNSTDFGHQPSRVVFTSVFGSYHGDWDSDNNIMRSVIAGNATGNSLGLTCFWSGRPNWFPHHLGMGEAMGYMTRASMNGGLTGGGGYVPGGSSYRGVHIGLMGDPALRMHAVEPPRGLAGRSASGQVALNWAASTESGLQGYHVYRADNVTGPFTKLTASPLAGASYTDNTVSAGSTYTYLVRTLKLERVPGGSYYNLSVGSAITLTASGAPSVVPLNPTELTVVSQTSSTSAQLTWKDNANDETGFRIERKTNASGTFATIGTLAANTTSYTDAGPFTQGNVYYYRVIATGAEGDSVASNEVSFDAVAGFVEFTTTRTKVNKTEGSATLNVTRFGGGTGAVTVNYATANSSAVAGTHFTATSGTLSWADGEQGTKTITVPIINTAGPQLPRQFKVSLSSPSNGAGLAQWTSIAVLIEDPNATLDPTWTSTVVGSITASSPAVTAEGVLGDSTMGGSGVTTGTSDAGRFTYQSRTGDGVITMQVPTPTPAQSGARFAVMVRASTSNTAIMAATVTASSTANFGTRLAYRSSVSGSALTTPSADNNLDTPQWVRLTRAGNTFTSEASADGNTWTTLGSTTIAAMPANALWGIFHYSADWASSTTYLGDYQLATYQNVSITPLPVPATPAGLTVGTVTNTSVTLTWTASTYAAGYRIERRGDDGTFDVLADITSGATVSFTDTTVAADTAYEYRIRAYNGSGESGLSSAVRTITPPADVITVLATDGAGGADAAIRADNPTTNFGASTTLPVTSTDIATGELTPVTKAWLRFNLGSLPTLKSAKLKLAYVGEQNLQAVFGAKDSYAMNVRALAESSDGWDESTIHWNNAPQNSTTGIGLTGSSSSLVTYSQFESATLPAVNEVVTINFPVTLVNSNRGANNLLTLVLVPSVAKSGSMIWASREHATLPAPALEVATASLQPKRPGFLTVTPGAGSSMELTWFDSASDETDFQIERRVANGDWTLLQTVGADITSLTDSTALPGVFYEYRVRATGAAGSSSWATLPAVTHNSAASITGAVFSPNGLTFNYADAPAESAYVPTGLTYFAPASNFVTGQTLSTTLRNNADTWKGMKITIGATPIVVHEVARWVLAGNTGAHTVKFVDAATSLDIPGASAVVETAGAPVGFKYVPLARPVTLAANTSYLLVSQEFNGGDNWYEGNTSVAYPISVATVDQSVWSNAAGTVYTLNYSPNNSYIPVSFRYSGAASPFVSGHAMTTLRNDYTGWLGMEITTGSTLLTVNQLGRWVVAGNSGNHGLRLVEAATGTTLGSAVIATAGAPSGQFKYADLPATITLAPNTRYYVLSRETAGGDQWYDFRKPAAGTATGYQQWLLANGLPMDESGQGSATATPASDSLPNLVKYALGLSPGVNGSNGHLTYGTINDAGSVYLTLSYTRPEPAPAGISVVVEASDNLSTWSADGLMEVGNTTNGNTRTITIRDTMAIGGNSKRFMRLRVTQP